MNVTRAPRLGVAPPAIALAAFLTLGGYGAVRLRFAAG